MARRILTAKRAEWARSRQHTGHIKGKPLRYPAAVMMRYAARLRRLTTAMTMETLRELKTLFEHEDVQAHFDMPGAAMDVSPASQSRILTNKLKAKFEQMFAQEAKPAASDMVDQANAAGQSATYSSLTELSGGLSLKTDILSGAMKEFMTGTVARNVDLIKSIPEKFFGQIKDEVLSSITDGKGLADLVPKLEERLSDLGDQAHRRAENIAYDQTRKAYGGLNKGRMEALGLEEYEWIHSGGGQHPRQMHIDMDGKIYRFDSPPIIEEDGERGIPGQAINCGCTMRPVVRFAKGGQA